MLPVTTAEPCTSASSLLPPDMHRGWGRQAIDSKHKVRAGRQGRPPTAAAHHLPSLLNSSGDTWRPTHCLCHPWPPTPTLHHPQPRALCTQTASHRNGTAGAPQPALAHEPSLLPASTDTTHMCCRHRHTLHLAQEQTQHHCKAANMHCGAVENTHRLPSRRSYSARKLLGNPRCCARSSQAAAP